ncbi:hypothetical protein CPB83DRAFT_630475 [Crepidotus variabilis]|uniref:Uncharacterized protein n=1 Tax=Crepidotus variabilis TaxID=179855 RepID=A0A9P6EQ27_9AGAR|nr:hypothetical protein CPB83DRAFT_630475 [Crepidotus variabilis]
MTARYDRRQIYKYSLSLMNVRVLYERITLNRLTTCYTIAVLISCVVLISLQAVTFVDNSQAITRLTPIVRGPNVPTGIPIELGDHKLFICPSLYDQTAKSCRLIVDFATNVQTPPALSNVLPESCVISLMYLDDIVHNARREDVVTFVFQLWMLGVSLFAIIAQSIPHISAVFLGHVLGTIWSAYRLASTTSMRTFYQANMVPKACGGVDVVGNWWNVRIGHDIATTVLNILVLQIISFLSFKLYNIYTSQTRARVAASPQVYSAYKFFLLFAAVLQLSVFYALASTGMWIDKVSHAPLKQLATHSTLYLAGFIVSLIFQVPWLLFGWTTIRYEGRILFLAFLGISGGLLILFTVIFFSHIYLYTFVSWPFFGAMTMTSYVLLVLTTVLAVICRLKFGQGLAEFLNAKEELEAADFTPVDFQYF